MGSARVKAAYRMLVKLTPDVVPMYVACLLNIYTTKIKTITFNFEFKWTKPTDQCNLTDLNAKFFELEIAFYRAVTGTCLSLFTATGQNRKK